MSHAPSPVLLAVALVAACVAAAVAGPLADSLARRERLRVPRPPQWRSLALAAPRRVAAAVVVSAAVGVRWGSEPVAAAVALATVGVAALAALVDRRCQRLPDVLVAPLGAALVLVAAGWSVVWGEQRWFLAAVVAAVVAGGVLLVGWVAGMGLGDVKFGAVLGLAVGWPTGSGAAAALGGLGLVGLAAGGASLWWGWERLVGGRPPRWFPFGPFLTAAAVVGLLLVGPPQGPGGEWVEPVRPVVPGHR